MNRKTMFSLITITLFSFSLFFLVTCKKDLTSPDGDEPQMTMTIGPDGGTLETADFTLHVPAGVFQTEATISIFLSTDASPFGDNSVSSMFIVEGLPDDFQKPIPVKFKYNGTLSEESYIVMGEEATPISLNELTTAYHLLDAEDSSGWLVGTLPAPGTASAKRQAQTHSGRAGEGYISIALGTISHYMQITSNEGHFRIMYPMLTVSSSDVNALAGFLEEAYIDVRDSLGFDYSTRTSWPVVATVMPFTRPFRSPEAFGYSVCSRLGNNFAWLEFNSGTMSNHEEMRATAGHEFFHLIQSLYDPRLPGEKAGNQPEHLWLNEAMSVWSEGLFTDQQNFISKVYSENVQEPFFGMHTPLAAGQSASQNHGYGMVPMIEYLTRQHGTGCLVEIYKRIGNARHPVEAIATAAESPGLWLEAFLRDYSLGNLYSLQVSNLVQLATSNSQTYEITSPEDTLQVYSRHYKDLSARMFFIKLRDANMDSTASLSFSIDDNTGNFQITVFKYGAGSIEYVTHTANGQTSPSISVPNLKKDYMDQNRHVLAMVTHTRGVLPYTDSTAADLTIKVKKNEETPPPDYNYCSVSIRTVYDIHWEDTYDSTSGDRTESKLLSKGFYGTLNGNSFSGTPSQSSDHPNIVYEGSLKVDLNSSMTQVGNFSVSLSTTNPYSDYTEHHVVEVFTVNGGTVSGSDGRYKIEGTGTCSHITLNDFNSIHKSTDLGNDRWLSTITDTTSSTSCDAQSMIELIFAKY